jgi:hypothetical protein
MQSRYLHHILCCLDSLYNNANKGIILSLRKTVGLCIILTNKEVSVIQEQIEEFVNVVVRKRTPCKLRES